MEVKRKSRKQLEGQLTALKNPRQWWCEHMGFPTPCEVRVHLATFTHVSAAELTQQACSVAEPHICREVVFRMTDRDARWATVCYLCVLVLSPFSSTFFPQVFEPPWLSTLASHSTIPEDSPQSLYHGRQRPVNEAIAGASCIFRTIFCAPVWLPSELMENKSPVSLCPGLSLLHGWTQWPCDLENKKW